MVREGMKVALVGSEGVEAAEEESEVPA